MAAMKQKKKFPQKVRRQPAVATSGRRGRVGRKRKGGAIVAGTGKAAQSRPSRKRGRIVTSAKNDT